MISTTKEKLVSVCIIAGTIVLSFFIGINTGKQIEAKSEKANQSSSLSASTNVTSRRPREKPSPTPAISNCCFKSDKNLQSNDWNHFYSQYLPINFKYPSNRDVIEDQDSDSAHEWTYLITVENSDSKLLISDDSRVHSSSGTLCGNSYCHSIGEALAIINGEPYYSELTYNRFEAHRFSFSIKTDNGEEIYYTGTFANESDLQEMLNIISTSRF
jgi:hypothetical protein